MNTIVLFEEYRLIERSETEINSAWKGVHLLLFFLAFVFASFCTFCFQMLMYWFNEKCILYPKLLSLTPLQHVYDFIPVSSKKIPDEFPVDFVTSQWTDKSICYLPTFMPLVSAICGLIWTTMFLMSSTGNQRLTGLQHPWRVLPPIFIFSLAMGGLCIHSACVTHSGLQDLYLKLCELTKSKTYTDSNKAARQAYEHQIRDIYQMIKLTIIASWLHAACWALSTVLTLVRVLIAADFKLIKVRAELQGNIDNILENHERQLRTVYPDTCTGDKDNNNGEPYGAYIQRTDIANVICENKRLKPAPVVNHSALRRTPSHISHTSKLYQNKSVMTLLPSQFSNARLSAFEPISKEKHFIINLLYDLLESLELDEGSSYSEIFQSSSALNEVDNNQLNLFRQDRQEAILSKTSNSSIMLKDVENVSQNAKDMQYILQNIKNNQLDEMSMTSRDTTNSAESFGNIYDLSTSIDAEIRQKLNFQLNIALDELDRKRINMSSNESNSKNVAIQTNKSKRTTNSTGTQHEIEKNKVIDKETQILSKEKQD